MGEDERVIIVPCELVEDEEQAELTIYSNWDNSGVLGAVAEYREDLLNSDIIETMNTPIKYIYADEE